MPFLSPAPSVESKRFVLGVVLWLLAASLLAGCDGNAGDVDGPCYGNGTCNAGLACEDAVCVALEGDEGQACYGNGTCNAGLTCEAAVCVAPQGQPEGTPSVEPDSEPSASPAVSPGVEPEGNPGDCVGAAALTGQDLDGFQGDRIAWRDSNCLPREVFLVRPDVQDPAGSFGGVARRFTYETENGTRTNTSSNPVHPGFGEVVNHYTGGANVSNRVAGAWRVVFEGDHHVIYEYTYALGLLGGVVDATVWWIFVTGRNHPIYAITYDATDAGADAVSADSRSPYGDINFDGDVGGDVEGVGWGDRYRFRTTGSGPVTFSSPWTYAEPNRIPHVISWSDSFNGEMGLVQTQEWERKDAGGYWFYANWGETSDGRAMPEDWNWTYQLNQYELPFTTASHRVAWGTNYGAVGRTSYPVYGDDAQASGYPYQSYAVFVALGERGEVDRLIGATEALQDGELSCVTGTPKAQGTVGAGRTDSQPFDNGYNPVFASFDVDASAGGVDCTLDIGPTPVKGLLLRLHGASGTIAADGDFVTSTNPETNVTWVSLLGARSGTIRVTAN